MFIKSKEQRPNGFTDEVMETLKDALVRAEGRIAASERYMARGSRLSGIARQQSDAGELTRDSEAGAKVAAQLDFFRTEVVGEAFMGQASAMVAAVAVDWATNGEPPDSLVDSIIQNGKKMDSVPFTQDESRVVTLSQIAMACIEQTATGMGADSLVLDERMPPVLAESALQIAIAITGTPDDEYVCDDCAHRLDNLVDEENAHKHADRLGPSASIQALSLGPDGVKRVSDEELKEIYKREGKFGHGSEKNDEKDEKKKKK